MNKFYNNLQPIFLTLLIGIFTSILFAVPSAFAQLDINNTDNGELSSETSEQTTALDLEPKPVSLAENETNPDMDSVSLTLSEGEADDEETAEQPIDQTTKYITQQQSATLTRNQSLVLNLTLEDLTPETIILAGNPARGEAVTNLDDGTVKYTPNKDFVGTDLLVLAYQYQGETDYRGLVLNINVTAAPDEDNGDDDGDDNGDIIIDGEKTFDINQNKALNVTFGFEGITSPTIEVLTNPANGTAQPTSDQMGIVYLPSPDFNGSDSLIIKFCYSTEEGGKCTTQKLTINVVSTTEFPIKYELSNTSKLAFDLSRSNMTINSIDTIYTPKHGTIVSNLTDQTMVYTPETNYKGSDSFKVRVCYQPDLSCAVLYYALTIK